VASVLPGGRCWVHAEVTGGIAGGCAPSVSLKPRNRWETRRDGGQGPEDGYRGVDEPVRETAQHVGQPVHEDLPVQSRDWRVYGQNRR